MNVGLLILRVVVGALFVGHGTQKLFGWFGGHGLRGTGGFYANIGFRPGPQLAAVAGVSEAGGGLLVLLGVLTPLGAAAIIGVMTAATLSVHLDKGVWNSDGGFEFPLDGRGRVGAGVHRTRRRLHRSCRRAEPGRHRLGATLVGVMAGLGMNAYRMERLRRAAEEPAAEERRRAA